MKKLSFLGLFSLLSVLAFGQGIPKTMLRLPDTGQSGNYTQTFGEDSDYTGFAPFFLKNGNGTVTDTVTGLMWQQKDGGEMSVENAQVYCDTLSLGGFTDWRLPNAHESFSILNHQVTNPAQDGSVFIANGAEYWWTSSRQVNDANKVWVTNSGGGIGNHPKTETISAGGSKRFQVRAVRDLLPLTLVPSHFTDNGDSTITDHLTGLVWQKVPFPDSMSWEQALGYAENLSLAGHSDWRLPNIRELQSINEENRFNPSVNPAYFGSIGVKKYWSSTSLPNQTSKAWYLDTRFGITTYNFKIQQCNLICVRGPVSVTTTTSELANEQALIAAFPNPFTDHIYLNPAYTNREVTLVSLFGQVIYSGNALEKQDFSGLPKGVYYLKIQGAAAKVLPFIKA